MIYSASVAIGMILVSTVLTVAAEGPIGAAKRQGRADFPAEKKQVQAPKKKLFYEFRHEKGRLMVDFHNDSAMDLAIKFGETKALLKAGHKKRIGFPNQQAVPFQVYMRDGDKWRSVFAVQVPRQPGKGAVPLER